MPNEMPMLDVDALLMPVSDASPCGEALDYDMDFLQLELAARGRDEQQMGDSFSAGAEPDWPTVESLAYDLCRRSKDIRIAALFVRALLHGRGFSGLAEGLRLLAGYVGGYWDGLHPCPEPDEDDTIRINALAALVDPAGLLGEVRRAPLTRSRGAGGVSLRDIQAAVSDTGGGGAGLSQVDIEAAFLAAGPAELPDMMQALASCVASVGEIAAAIADRESMGGSANLAILREVLEEALGEIGARMPLSDETAAPGETSDAVTAAPVSRAAHGEIRGRSDVVLQLDVICRWYAANEPGSPVPILLERAKRLVSQDFLALLAELAPEGLGQFRILAGIQNDEA